MRFFKNIIIATSAILSVATTSCGSFDDLNTDPTKLVDANPGVFLNPTLYGLASYNFGRYYSFTAYINQNDVYTQSSGGIGWWVFTDSAGDGAWSTYYKWLANIQEMYNYAVELDNPNYIALSNTLKCYVYHNLVDAFGDVPMSEACQAEQGILTPKFDSEMEIYASLIDLLDEANSTYDLTTGLEYNTSADLLYNTSSSTTAGIALWQKFTNSLRMRVLLRVIDVDGLDAKSKLVEMINNPDKYPVFESNDDAALLEISGVDPESVPVTSNYYGLFRQYTKFFMDPWNEMQDPRRAYFANKTTNASISSTSDYYGQENAWSSLDASWNGSGMNSGVVGTPMKLTLMSYAEVEFIRAELAHKGIISSYNAAESLEKGIEAAITMWGLELPEDHFENPANQYDGTFESIMTHKFYALIFDGFQQWFEVNRTGIPEIPRGEGMDASNHLPFRFIYPSDCLVYNSENYYEAVSSLGGGDEYSSELMWHNRDVF